MRAPRRAREPDRALNPRWRASLRLCTIRAMPPESATRPAAILPRAALLPPFGEYIRAVWALGLRALRPGLPALVFVYFYRLGMGLYMAYSAPSSDTRPAMPGGPTAFLMMVAGYLPMLVLVYTPFLPFLDSLLRGSPASFVEAVKQVLEVAWQFLVSLIAQMVIVLAPVMILVVAAAALSMGVPGAGLLQRLQSGLDVATMLRLWIAALCLIPAFAWIVFAGFHLLFATPGVVLGRLGPLASIGHSWQIVGHYFWRLLGRLLGYALLVMLVSIVASMPAVFLTAAATASGTANPVLKIPGVIWSSAIDALLFPFGVAALLLLYRAIVPAGASAASGAAGSAEPEARPTSPFLFE